MANCEQWSVRIERQPHRDAVDRLRVAYRRLWLMNQPLSGKTERSEKATEATHTVQEVSS